MRACLLHVGFNPTHKLSKNGLLKQKININERIKHKTNIHKDFPLDPKNVTTSLIFHSIPFNVTTHIYIYMSKNS